MFKEKFISIISFIILVVFTSDCGFIFLTIPAFFLFTYNISIIILKNQTVQNSRKELILKLEYLAVLSCIIFLAGILAFGKTLESCSLFWKLSILVIILTLLTLYLLGKKYNLLGKSKLFIFILTLFYLSLISTIGVYTNKYIIVDKNVSINVVLISKEVSKGRRGSLTHKILFNNNNRIFKIEVDKNLYNSVNEFDEIILLTNKGILESHYILKVSKIDK